MNTIPQIKKVYEIGETPFQVIEVKEKILQGWNENTKRAVYLFRTNSGKWGYYDKLTKQFIDILEWKGKAAFIEGDWVLMGVYYKLHLLFSAQVTYTEYVGQYRGKKVNASEGIVNITASAYEALEAQRKGRTPETLYKFTYKKGKKASYVVGAIWVDPTTVQ